MPPLGRMSREVALTVSITHKCSPGGGIESRNDDVPAVGKPLIQGRTRAFPKPREAR